jgi:arsenate reductase
MNRKRRVLFLCTGNSARSQMAEGLVNSLLGDRWQAYSAGTQPSGSVHPLAVKALEEWGIDISNQEPKSVQRFEDDDFDAVITLCDDAARNCPFWVGAGTLAHMAFADPAQAEGDLENQLGVFRQARDAMRERVLVHLRQIEDPPDKETSDDSRDI